MGTFFDVGKTHCELRITEKVNWASKHASFLLDRTTIINEFEIPRHLPSFYVFNSFFFNCVELYEVKSGATAPRNTLKKIDFFSAGVQSFNFLTL